MKVQCKFCVHENNGFCQAKAKRGQAIAIKTNKRRTCSEFSEDAYKVLAAYRKTEAHKSKLRNIESRKAQLNKAIQEARKAGLKEFARPEVTND